ncbi:hypothetical protein CUR178_07386 [Leishmania enriettii]|uniref:Uncharacterized protein n=1 Tax=Leishmania enriettii TaxID=5663 RepID=A0A836HHH8_LEIEN|nr:hypothetical protein CUR178_07386 [Leishmania enriettii]
MDHNGSDERIGFPSSSSPSQANASRSASMSNTPRSPHAGSLRARRFPSQRLGCPDGHHYSLNGSIGSAGGGVVALARLENQELFGPYPPMPALQYRHQGDPIVSLVGHQSLDSMGDLLSVSPTSQALAPAFSFYASKDNVTVSDYYAVQSPHSLSKNVTVIYSPASSPSDAFSRGADYVSARGMSVTEEDANEDRVKVRVEGYYENNRVGVLIPNDLPPSTLLYVLTASDGRDLMFKLMQYTLQIAICFLTTPSLFSAEVQALTGPMAERLYRNYNTIRHGRSLFKMGRGLLNLFTLQTVCERMWMKYESGIARATCAVLMPLVSRLERGLLLMGASPLWGQYVSCRLLHWVQAAQGTAGQRHGEVLEGSVVLDRRIQQRMRALPSTPSEGGTSQLDEARAHHPEADKPNQSRTSQPSHPAPPCATEENRRTQASGANSERQPTTTNDGAAGKGKGRLPCLPSGHLSTEGWGGRTTPETATAAPTPNAASKCDSSGPDALPRVTSTPAPADRVHDAGRKTLLRPLKRPSLISTPTRTRDSSVTGDDADDRLHVGAGSSITRNGTPLTTVQRSPSCGSITSQLMPELASGSGLTPGDGPLSVPNNWRVACAPTVPPSHSDELAAASTLPYTSADSLRPLNPIGSFSAAASPSEATMQAEVTTDSSSTLDSADTRLPPPPLSPAADMFTGAQAATASPVDDTEHENQPESSAGAASRAIERNGHRTSSLRDRCRVSACSSTSPVTAVLPASELPVAASLKASFTLTDTDTPLGGKECKESDMSILSSSTTSIVHERRGVCAGSLSTWLRELQPASAAMPVRWRKGVLQFNPVLMALLGVRNLAAACRRFLRDMTLISTERFVTFTFIEANRRAITRAINRCWLAVSIIDLLLNTVRLLQPGWVKYATARQNINCRCGCGIDDELADKVRRTHGFVAWRKADLFFPPLDLDYGAPFVSSIAYPEAADPANMMPACSRCGFLYREVPSETDQEAEEAEAADASGDVSMLPSRTLTAASKAAANAPHAERVATVPLGEDGHGVENHCSAPRTSVGAAGMTKREKPRWARWSNEEGMLGESQLLQQRVRGPGTRRETSKRSDEAHPNLPVEQLEKRRGSHAMKDSISGGPSTGEVLQRRRSGSARERPAESSAGILFVPWIMRKFFDYVWLLRVHPNLTSTVLLEARCIAELYLAYKYCLGNCETFMADAPLWAILNPYAALAGIVSAAVGMLRVIQSAPSS